MRSIFSIASEMSAMAERHGLPLEDYGQDFREVAEMMRSGLEVRMRGMRRDLRIIDKISAELDDMKVVTRASEHRSNGSAISDAAE